jgi:selenocysteine lyase/cysteine desulfurase
VNEARFPGVRAAQRAGRVLADNAAASQLPAEAIDAVTRYLTDENAQKGSTYPRAIHTTEIVEEARATFAELIGVAPGDVGFGANATSMAYAFARTIAHAVRPGDRIVITESDHYANVIPWSWLQRFGAELDVIAVDERGDLIEASVARALEREPLLVALPWASNATGTIFDIARLSERANAAGAMVVVDGVQAAPHFALTMPRHVDFAFFSAYKIFAPHFGAWYARADARERFFRHDDPYMPSTELNWSMETGTASFEALAGWLGTVAYLRDVGGGSLPLAMDRLAAHEGDLTRAALARFAERADQHPRPRRHHALAHVRRRGHRDACRRLLRPALIATPRARLRQRRRPHELRPLQHARRPRPLLHRHRHDPQPPRPNADMIPPLSSRAKVRRANRSRGTATGVPHPRRACRSLSLDCAPTALRSG